MNYITDPAEIEQALIDTQAEPENISRPVAWLTMNDKQRATTMHALASFGGRFEARLAELFRVADITRAIKLGAAFSAEVRMYGPGSEAYAAEIMNLKADPESMPKRNAAKELGYCIGHRDARHAAAELAMNADALRDELLAALQALIADDDKDREIGRRGYMLGSPADRRWKAARAVVAKATGAARQEGST